jgi:hypothetical protein
VPCIPERDTSRNHPYTRKAGIDLPFKMTRKNSAVCEDLAKIATLSQPGGSFWTDSPLSSGPERRGRRIRGHPAHFLLYFIKTLILKI